MFEENESCMHSFYAKRLLKRAVRPRSLFPTKRGDQVQVTAANLQPGLILD